MQSVASLVQRSCAVAGPAAKRRLGEVLPSVSVASFHSAAASLSAQQPGPVEKKLRADYANYVPPESIDPSVVRPSPDGKKVYSAKVKRLADEISHLTLLETLDLTDILKDILGMSNSDLLLPFTPGGAAGAGGAAPAAAAAAAPAEAPKEEKKAEVKTHVDIKLKAFDAKNKIKVIKEIRGVTNLGLKEAKDLVESAPCTIMQKVKAEEAAKIVEKLKAETGGEYELV